MKIEIKSCMSVAEFIKLLKTFPQGIPVILNVWHDRQPFDRNDTDLSGSEPHPLTAEMLSVKDRCSGIDNFIQMKHLCINGGESR